METTQLIIIILGLLAACAMILIGTLAFFNRKLAEAILGIAGPALLALRNQGEAAIVNSGADLSLVHNFLMLIKPYVDGPDDKIIIGAANLFHISKDQAAEIASKVWAEAVDFTDGEIEPEVAGSSLVAGAGRL